MSNPVRDVFSMLSDDYMKYREKAVRYGKVVNKRMLASDYEQAWLNAAAMEDCLVAANNMLNVLTFPDIDRHRKALLAQIKVIRGNIAWLKEQVDRS